MKSPVDNETSLWRSLFPVPIASSHKYSRGTALVRGGDKMTGAARLATRAAQRAGAGLVTLASPQSVLPIYAESLESVIVRACDTLDVWQSFVMNEKEPALLLGPGLEASENLTKEIEIALLAKRATVLDAGALTNFASSPNALFDQLHYLCVLTPHEGEFTKLFGALSNQRVEDVASAAKRAGCTVLLKGAETVIANPSGEVVIDRSGPPWLATAGSGDVLSGIILGLVAQKMPVFWATAAAAWIHGQSAAKHGAGLIAEDIIDGLPAVLQGILDHI